MKEVTNQTPYNQYGGRSFICTREEAEQYVVENCNLAHHVDVVNNFYTQKLENIVWWESEFSWSDKGTRKIAHYNAPRNLLVVFLYK